MTYSIEKDNLVILNWDLSRIFLNKNLSNYVLIVYSSEEKAFSASCFDCSAEFSSAKKISLSDVCLEGLTISYFDEIKLGNRYFYKFNVISKDGLIKCESNIVTFEYGL